MLKGAAALVIRYALYALGAGLVGAGAATMTSADHFCMSVSAVADVTATALVMMLGGGSTFVASTIWSRWVKRRHGVT